MHFDQQRIAACGQRCAGDLGGPLAIAVRFDDSHQLRAAGVLAQYPHVVLNSTQIHHGLGVPLEVEGILRQLCQALSPGQQRLAQEPSPGPDPEALWEQEFQQHLFRLAAAQLQESFAPTTWQAFWRTAVEGQSGAAVAAGLCYMAMGSDTGGS